MLHGAARVRNDAGHAVEKMRHARVAGVAHLDACLGQPVRVGPALVAHRVEFRGVDVCRRQAAEIRGAKRRHAWIGRVQAGRDIVLEIPVQRRLVQQISLREGAARLGVRGKVGDRAQQQLGREPDSPRLSGQLADDCRKRAAGRIAAYRDPVPVDPQLGSVLDGP